MDNEQQAVDYANWRAREIHVAPGRDHSPQPKSPEEFWWNEIRRAFLAGHQQGLVAATRKETREGTELGNG